MVLVRGREGWLAGGGSGNLYGGRDLRLVGEGGGPGVVVSKLLFSAISPVIHQLLVEQGFCSGCLQTPSIILPWTTNDKLREFSALINSLEKDGMRRQSEAESFRGIMDAGSVDTEMKELVDQLRIHPQYQDLIWYSARGLNQSKPSRRQSSSSSTKGRKRKPISLTVEPAVKLRRLDLSQLNVTVKQEPVDYLQTEEEPQLRMSPEDSLAMERKRETMERKREELRKVLPGIQVLGANLVKSEDSANKQEIKIQENVTESTDVPMNYFCHICHSNCQNRQRLYFHYAMIHYKDEMTRFANIDPCEICGLKSTTIKGAMSHMASTHSIVDQFLPKEYQRRKCAGKKPKPGSVPAITRKDLAAKLAESDAVQMKTSHAAAAAPDSSESASQSKSADLGGKESSSKACEMPYSCGLGCDSQFKNRAMLYVHYASSHYKDEIDPYLTKDSCAFCNKPFESRLKALFHIASFHSVVEQFLPKKYHMKKKTGANKKMGAAPKKIIVAKKKKKLHPKNKNRPRMPKCYLCKKSFDTRTKLYKHYAGHHFRSKMKEMVSDCKVCPYCDKPMASTQAAFYHLACGHSLVDQFLPAEHRLKKCGKKGFLKSFDNTDPTNAVLPPVNQTDTTNAALVTNKISMTMTDGHAESIIDLNNSVAAPSKADNKVSLNSAGRTMFHCYMCKFKNTRTSLYTHYATVHFKDEMQPFMNVRTCPIVTCGKKLNHQNSIIHIASTHSYVERFLAPEHHLKKQRTPYKAAALIHEASAAASPRLGTQEDEPEIELEVDDDDVCGTFAGDAEDSLVDEAEVKTGKVDDCAGSVFLNGTEDTEEKNLAETAKAVEEPACDKTSEDKELDAAKESFDKTAEEPASGKETFDKPSEDVACSEEPSSDKVLKEATFGITIGESFSTQHNIKEEAESDDESDAINDFSIDIVDNLSIVNLELTHT